MIDTEEKIAQADTLQELLATLPRPLVFTNGCFDILHRGHISYLQSARNLGASLVVGVNSDSSVRRQNKGSDRPINNLTDRMALLAALQCVDAVVAFDNDTPEALIQEVNPDHLVKGGDWEVADIVGGDFVKQGGGEVHSIAFEHDRSTTQLLQKIRSL